ncbi:MAG: amino acid/amide transporter rane protein 2, family / amino acid/amide transporter [Actinomycetia bacterium]|nr:amino acid/amide transporter rane protein 2, family / amino acid/amide transporter [Actinomycetes bacterium]
MDFEKLFVFLTIGVSVSAIYAVSATGLVVTYVTSGVFNFAHGAIGMFLAFTYWELSVNRGWPVPVALAVTLLVIAPAIGVALDVLVMRRLVQGASVATKLVVTLALLVVFQGGAILIWGIRLRTLPELFPGHDYSVFSLVITWHQTVTVLAAASVAFGLRTLFKRTRLGVAMRAVVDNPELCSVKGISANVVTATSWALGASLAGLAAILIAPGLNLEVNTLSLLVVSAYAAAVVGRLQSLPATFVGALILGVSQQLAVGYLPTSNEWLANLRPALPFVLLFVALLLRSEHRLPERLKTHAEPAPPRVRTTLVVGALVVAAAVPVSGWLSPSNLLIGSRGFLFACIVLSLVLLTGLSGQVSLMQMSFVGLGAVLAGKLPPSFPFPVTLAIAGVVTGLVGIVVALPAVRLRGIYLALSTLAFAILMDNIVFGNRNVLGGGTTLRVERPSLFGLDLSSERSLFVVLAIVAVVFAHVFLAVRRSRFGRLLTAMRDAPNACQTLGMNVTRAKLQVFFLSALLAGVAGVFFGGLQSRVGQLDFLYFRSLTVLLVATIFGITSVSGAFLGAAFFVVLPELTRHADSSGGQAIQPLVIGLLAIATARRQEGVAGRIRALLRPILRRVPAFRPVAGRPSRDIDLRDEPATVTTEEVIPVGAGR